MMAVSESDLDSLAAVLSGYRVRFATELGLQEDIAEILTREGIAFSREHRLDAASRIDFYLPEKRIGIECKVDGTASAILRQLVRYAAHPNIDALMLVSRSRLHQPGVLNLRGKPIRFVWVGQAGL